jgi:hypothetical protein
MAAIAHAGSHRSKQFASGPLALAGIAVFTFLVCYFRSFVFPKAPVLSWGDHLGFFYNGARIVSGELPYRDYFEIVSPGTDLIYAFLIKCFGLRTWVPNLLMAVVGAAMACIITVAARRVLRGTLSLLPALLFTGFILYASLDPTHHWFSTLAVMCAMLVLLDGTSMPRIAAAGALCGLAACFTQSKGATAVLSFLAYFLWKTRRDRSAANNLGAETYDCGRKCLTLCGAAAGVFFAVNAYFIGSAGLQRWLYCIIIFPLRYYPAPTINNWRVVLFDFQSHGGALKWISYPFVYITVPLVYILFFLVMYRQRLRWPLVPWDRLVLIALTGLGMFLAIASAPSMKRLSTAGAPAMILLAWLLDEWWLNRTRKVPPVFNYGAKKIRAERLLLLAVAAFALEPALHNQLRPHGYLNLPAGRTAFSDRLLYAEYAWVLANTHPGQFFFGMPPFYIAFHIRNPAATDAVESTEYTRPEQVAALVQALKSHPVPLLILNKSLDLMYPADPSSDHAGAFRAYVLQNYRLVLRFPTGDDVWQKI